MSGRDGSWPLVPLRQVVARSQDWIDLKPDERYRQVTVRLWGKGVVLRDEVDGIQVAATRRLRVRTGQLILSRIDARNGAIGIVPDELDGAIVSNDFPAFDVDTAQLLPAYLGWLTKTRSFVEACRAASEGTTNRIRLVENRFLGIEIPVPPLDEQRRIVAELVAAASGLERANALRQRIASELSLAWQSSLSRAFGGGDTFTVEGICSEIVDNLHSTPSYDGEEFLCVRSQDIGWGWISYAAALRTSGAEFLTRTRRAEPQAGDIVFVREGDVGRCAVVDGSRRFSLGQRVMMLRPDPRTIDPSFLMWQLMSPPVLRDQILTGKTGTTSHHVNVGRIRAVRVRVPSLDEQRRVVLRLAAFRSRLRDIEALLAHVADEQRALHLSILATAFRDGSLTALDGRGS